MEQRKFSEPGDLVYIAPSYAKDRPYGRKWVGTPVIVIGRHKDRHILKPIFYYEVVADGNEYLISVEDVQLEPVHPDWMKDKID